MALVDSVLNIFNKQPKNEDKPSGSRSEREAKIKDKAGLVINVFALLLAVNTWYGGKLSSTIMNNTISANNQWSWYQAKNVRSVVYEVAAVQAGSPVASKKFLDEQERMDQVKKEIASNAIRLEKERDEAKLRSPWIGYANTAYQLAIVLLSASILAVSMYIFWGSFLVAGVGILLSLQGLFLFF